jgi:hypothetical protein
MEPHSRLATSSTLLVIACTKVLGCMSMFGDKSQSLDTAVRVLEFELNSLSHVSRSLSESRYPPYSTKVFSSHSGRERYYWQTVKEAIDECTGTLTHLAQIFDKAVEKCGAGSSWLWGSKRPKLSLSSSDLDCFKQQVEAYRQTMQLAIHMITW